MSDTGEVRAESVPLPVVWAAGSAREEEVAVEETKTYSQSRYSEGGVSGLKLSGASQSSKWLFGLDPNRCDLPLQCNTIGGPVTVDVQYTAFGAAYSVEPVIKEAIQKIGASTVLIRGYGAQGKRWSGSGVVIKPDDFYPGLSDKLGQGSYLLLTNHHVAADTTALVATLPNGQELVAIPLSSANGTRSVLDKVTDSAVLVIRPGAILSAAHLGDPSKMEIGDIVLTAGHPAGLPKLSVTRGVISQPQQSTGFVPFPVIQFDAAINGGNSGGPLVNLNGEVIGLNTFTFKNTNDMSFAMPISEQLKALVKIYEKGSVSRSTLGLAFESFPFHDRQAEGFPSNLRGARLSRVTGFWKQLFMKEGDVVTELFPLYPVSGKPLQVHMESDYDATDVNGWIQDLQPGTVLIATVWRQETDANGQVQWNQFQVPLVTDAQGSVDLTLNSWKTGAETYLRAA